MMSDSASIEMKILLLRHFVCDMGGKPGEGAKPKRSHQVLHFLMDMLLIIFMVNLCSGWFTDLYVHQHYVK